MLCACSRQDSGFNPPETCPSSFGILSRFAILSINPGKFLPSYNIARFSLIFRSTALSTLLNYRGTIYNSTSIVKAADIGSFPASKSQVFYFEQLISAALISFFSSDLADPQSDNVSRTQGLSLWTIGSTIHLRLFRA